jgi:DNA-binding response OmpR family regulator
MDLRRGRGKGRAAHVLVVDDDPDIRNVICMVLEKHGFRVTAFPDGQAAIDLARERPELILLDYMMPRLNADGFLAACTSHPMLRGVPIVVISAYPELADTVATRTVGVLHKPIEIEILLECVQYHTASA